MIAFTVTLPPELARFVADAVADGSWATADELFAYALSLARTATVLGKPPSQSPPPVVPPVNVRITPPSGTVPVVDLTRQTFDSSSFLGELTRKLHGDKK